MEQMNGAISNTAQYGGFWIRVGAATIDSVVMLIPMLLIFFLYRSAYPATDEASLLVQGLVENSMSIMVWWAYYSVLHSSRWQASIGKKVLGFKVVDQNGERISFGRATGRYFGYFFSLFTIVGIIMVGWTKKKQGLHDKLSKTYVIKSAN